MIVHTQQKVVVLTQQKVVVTDCTWRRASVVVACNHYAVVYTYILITLNSECLLYVQIMILKVE